MSYIDAPTSDWAILDEDHNVIPASLRQWSEQRRVALDASGPWRVGVDVVDDVRVSTVFLGVDHGWFGEHEWFETMVFEDEGKGWDQTLDRYATWSEAEEGHAEVVRRLRSGLPPWEDME